MKKENKIDGFIEKSVEENKKKVEEVFLHHIPPTLEQYKKDINAIKDIQMKNNEEKLNELLKLFNFEFYKNLETGGVSFYNPFKQEYLCISEYGFTHYTVKFKGDIQIHEAYLYISNELIELVRLIRLKYNIKTTYEKIQ